VSESDGALFWKITEGKAPMTSYEKLLPEEDRWHLFLHRSMPDLVSERSEPIPDERGPIVALGKRSGLQKECVPEDPAAALLGTQDGQLKEQV
jgi:hypothetical protein